MSVIHHVSSPPPNKVERMPTLIARTGLSKSEIYRRIQAGTFPQPVRLGARAVGWRAVDVDAWLDALAKRGAV
jgi:prophage regulatory protein